MGIYEMRQGSHDCAKETSAWDCLGEQAVLYQPAEGAG